MTPGTLFLQAAATPASIGRTPDRCQARARDARSCDSCKYSREPSPPPSGLSPARPDTTRTPWRACCRIDRRNDLLNRIATSHQAAVAIWNQHHGGIVGGLKAIAGLLMDHATGINGVGALVSEVAGGIFADARLAAPMQELEALLAEYAQYLNSCEAAIEASASIQAGWRARRRTTVGVILGAFVLLAVLSGAVAYRSLHASEEAASSGRSLPFEATVKSIGGNDPLGLRGLPTYESKADMVNLLRLKKEADGTPEYFDALIRSSGPLLAAGTRVRVVAEGRAEYQGLWIDYSEVKVISGAAVGRHLYIATANLTDAAEGGVVDVNRSAVASRSRISSGHRSLPFRMLHTNRSRDGSQGAELERRWRRSDRDAVRRGMSSAARHAGRRRSVDRFRRAEARRRCSASASAGGYFSAAGAARICASTTRLCAVSKDVPPRMRRALQWRRKL